MSNAQPGKRLTRGATGTALVFLTVLIGAITVEAVPFWSRTYQGVDREQAIELLQSDDGGFLVAGVTGDPALPTRAWLMRLDPDGEVTWEQSYVAQTQVFGSTVDGAALAADGSAVFTGRLVVDIRDEMSAWVTRIDTSGSIVWTTELGPGGPGGGRHFLIDAAFTSDGGVVAAGSTSPTDQLPSQAWIVKLDRDGLLLWQKKYDAGTAAHDVLETRDGDIVVAGSASPGAGVFDAWAMMVDDQGAPVWQTTIGGKEQEEAAAITELQDGGFAIAGWTDGFTPSGHSAWAIRLDGTGGVLWTRTVGTSWSDFRGVAETSDGGILFVGRLPADPSSPNDFWLAKLAEADGSHVWQSAFSGPFSSWGSVAVPVVGGGLLVGGAWAAGTDAEDLWVLRVGEDGIIPVCNRDPAPLEQPDLVIAMVSQLTSTVTDHDAVVSTESFDLAPAMPILTVQCDAPGCAAEGNVLLAVRQGQDVQLLFPNATGSAWRVYRNISKLTLGVSSLAPDATMTTFDDQGVVPQADDFYYQLKGVCHGVVGP